MLSAFWVTDAAIKSKSSRMPDSRSAMSRSLINGIEIWTPGMLTLLRSDIVPPLTTCVSIFSREVSSTLRQMSPSSINIRLPGFTSCQSPGKLIETCVLSPLTS